VYYQKNVTVSPEEVLTEIVDVKGAKFNELTFEIQKNFVYGQRTVLQWHAEADDIRPIPDSAEAALLPEQVKTNEQLYLTGMHLEQYRHATWLPTDYYEEALRRNPDDVRCLNAMGLWYIRKGRFAKAEGYLRKAVRLITKRNPNPYDSEPIYNLALALKYQGQYDEAYELFWKSAWSKAWTDAGYFEAAKISTAQGRYEDALDEVDRCLVSNWHNHKARALKTAILRKLGYNGQCLALIRESLQLDLFNYGCRYEQYLLEHDEDALAEMKRMLRKSAQNYDEVALDYQAAGLTDEARAVWQMAIKEGAVTPMTYYYLFAFCGEQDALERAETADPAYCFPNRPEDIIALKTATASAAQRINSKSSDAKYSKAPYYLGCLYYANRQYDLAIDNWECSARLDPQFPTVWRNLALARFNKQNRQQEALQYMERAFRLDENDERILMELDQLYKRLHRPHEQRLAFLQKYPQLILRRDDLVLEEITLLNQTGRYEEAMQRLDARVFHPWEGGEGKVSAQYQICRVELAKQAIVDKKYERAITLLNECLEYPHHLGEGKLYGAQENDFYYLLGVAYDAVNKKAKALACWEEATKGPQEPAAAIYYNDAKPDKIFYQGLALRKLGRENEAHGRFYRLINYGKQHIFEKQVMDYFAVSLPDLLIWEEKREDGVSELDTKNLIHCKYMLALGYYGMGDKEHAERYLKDVEQLDNNHQGIQQFRSLINARL
jgi:tetratricopeptide (TPR) repeat protein